MQVEREREACERGEEPWREEAHLIAASCGRNTHPHAYKGAEKVFHRLKPVPPGIAKRLTAGGTDFSLCSKRAMFEAFSAPWSAWGLCGFQCEPQADAWG